MTASAPTALVGSRKLRARLGKAVGQAIADFSMIADGDRILCAVSGGKDSYVMHELLVDLTRRAPVRFDVLAVNVDQGHPGYPREILHRYMDEGGHPFRMIHEDTYAVVKEKVPEGKTTCSLCSRLRRGILYTAARELGCNKIALGHHRDDVVTTLMLNLLFGGQLKAMPPKLVNDAGDVTVIRPLSYCAEDDIAAYASERGYPLIPCVLCGEQADMQRRVVSSMLADLEATHPGVRQRMLAALRNVRPSHLLDAGLWASLGLRVAEDDGSEQSVSLAGDGPSEEASPPPLVRLRRRPTDRVSGGNER
ncbi:MAG TPA: tRNA 2-thiocytidine(32) synthetase TtcA [Polyangiaceae bacterium]|nr:tRNA 2-thiocytidine(32) synthetase TtcA [Polyangiaceae bacterium]